MDTALVVACISGAVALATAGSSFIVCRHAAFHRDYDKVFAEWMERFADDLFTPAKVSSSNRLRLLQWALYGLVRQLDEQGAYGGGWIERSAGEISRTSPQGRITTHEQARPKEESRRA